MIAMTVFYLSAIIVVSFPMCCAYLNGGDAAVAHDGETPSLLSTPSLLL
jgi:hypothetical protein